MQVRVAFNQPQSSCEQDFQWAIPRLEPSVPGRCQPVALCDRLARLQEKDRRTRWPEFPEQRLRNKSSPSAFRKARWSTAKARKRAKAEAPQPRLGVKRVRAAHCAWRLDRQLR